MEMMTLEHVLFFSLKKRLMFSIVFILSFVSSARGSSAQLDSTVNVKEPPYSAVGDGIHDDTISIQRAYADLESIGGGILFFPRGIYLCNIIDSPNQVGGRVAIRGSGKDATFLKPASDAPVLEYKSNYSIVKIEVSSLSILGNPSYESQDGILILPQTKGTWVDEILISNVDITRCGRYGIRAEGASSDGPFTQRMHIEYSNLEYNLNAGLSLFGKVIETTIIGTFIDGNGGTSGTKNNCEIGEPSNDIYPSRIGFYGCVIGGSKSLKAGNSQVGMYLRQAQDVSFINCDFEQEDPMIFLTGSLLHNVTILGCNFGFSAPGGNFSKWNYGAIEVEQCQGLLIENNTFGNSSGVLIPYCIGFTGNTAKEKNVKIDSTNKFCPAENPVSFPGNVSLRPDATYIAAFQSDLGIQTPNGPCAISNIYDSNNTETIYGLVRGQTITIHPFDVQDDFYLEMGGNLLLSSGKTFHLNSETASWTGMWNGKKWLEIGRSN